MVGVVSLIPAGGNFIFLLILKPLVVSFGTKMSEISDLCYLGKTGMDVRFTRSHPGKLLTLSYSLT